MAPTRQIQIYRDGTAGHPPRPILDQAVSADDNNPFSRPSSDSSGRSPLKPVRQSNFFQPKPSASNVQVMLPIPQPQSFKTDSPIKKPPITGFAPLSRPKSTSLFTSFHTGGIGDKENRGPTAASDNIAEFPDPSHLYTGSLKRSFSAIDVSQETDSKKPRREEPTVTDLPDPRSLPQVEDDGGKPQLSYASLIGMAILRSPERKLTLAQIYKWISDSFAHYRQAKDSGWQNSIRHNLSLNKTFVKQERPKDDPGKGNYWTIVPGCEAQFLHKDRGSRRTTANTNSNNNSKASSRPASSEAHFSSALPSMSARATSQEVVQPKEPSSDATIPASDAPSSADDEEVAMPPPKLSLPQSSPLQDIRSSPPLLPEVRGDTPSPTADLELPSLTRPGQRKPDNTDIDDSGYFSCLESSVLRPYAEPKLPMLDGSLPKMKRGRAEEAIARMRSSSHDVSPSRVRSFVKQPTPSVASSSPSKPFEHGLMPPPLTPAVKMRMPAKPPPSVSPNTNLRIHRESIRDLIGSPFRPSLADDISYSPAFKILDDMTYAVPGNNDIAVDNFDANECNFYCRAASSSPVKEIGRPSERARRTSTILADITGSNNGKPSFYGRSAHVESPLRAKSGFSPLQFGGAIHETQNDDLFGIDFLDDEEPDDHSGFDISKGFSKIGSSKPPTVGPLKGARPSLGGRSQTSQF